MRLLICFILAISVTVVVTQRPSYSLSPVDWSVSVNAERPVKTVITGKDLIVDFEFYNPATIIRRRDAQGNYQVVVNLTEISATEATTNGKWIMLTGEGIGLFRLDQQNNLSSLYLVDNAGFVLSDDTIVGFNPFIRNEDGIVTIKTYEFNESNDTWVNIPGTELNVSGPINFPSYSTSSFRVSDTHLSMIDSSGENLTVNIYERQLNKSWSQIESVQIDGSHGPGSIIYNDVDTFVHSIFDVMVDEGLMGIVYIYMKSNGQWKEQSFTVSSVGYRSIGYLGGSVQFLDANNVLISAGYDGYDGSGTLSASSAGRVLLLTRNATGAWEPTLDLVSPSGIFGIGIGVNDYDILIPSIALGNPSYLTYNTAPRCFAQPINVTCSNQQVNDCSDVDVSSLFTVNNSPQCFTVKSSLNSVSLSNNEMITAQFSFTKAFGATAYCNATVSCPLPPSMTPVTQQLTPSKVSSSTAIEIGVLSLLVYVILL